MPQIYVVEIIRIRRNKPIRHQITYVWFFLILLLLLRCFIHQTHKYTQTHIYAIKCNERIKKREEKEEETLNKKNACWYLSVKDNDVRIHLSFILYAQHIYNDESDFFSVDISSKVSWCDGDVAVTTTTTIAFRRKKITIFCVIVGISWAQHFPWCCLKLPTWFPNVIEFLSNITYKNSKKQI